LELSSTALAQKPELMVWPEAAVPGFVRWETNTHDVVTRFAKSNHLWLILGADDARPVMGSADKYNVYNASFLVSPRGEFVNHYAKQNLVIFGEYIPFVRWLPFLERWTGMGSFTPGSGPALFEIPELGLKTSVVICFEDIFPHLVRSYVQSVGSDLDFLLNLTNNGWFGESSAQWQHAAGAIFRAVENGLPLVRVRIMD
jgi:apolipoprotein N-acyltransferase